MSQVVTIPGRPGFNALLWWFQGPSAKASDYSFELDGVPLHPAVLLNVGKVLNITLGTAGDVAARTFLAVTEHNNEPPARTHWLRVFYQQKDPSNYAYSRTLPDAADGLNMVLASCFYRDNNQLVTAAPLAKPFMSVDGLPHVKMLCGDQIYLDLSNGGWYPHKLNDLWRLYDEQWRDARFIAWMSRGGNLCMADDHEFWNNFPSQKRAGKISFIFSEPPEGIARKMEDAFLIYQAVLNADPADLLKNNPLNRERLHCFEFPGDLAPKRLRERFAMQVLDTRTRRTALDDESSTKQFTAPQWLRETQQRIANRNGPCLLVTSQSMLDRGGGSESNLADYQGQFDALWNTVWNNPHQMLLLTGDIHWSRAQSFKSEETKLTHYEVVSSALARISLPTLKWPDLNSTVKWDDHSVSATRTADCYVEHTYATLSFSTHDWGLRAVVRWWEINGNGQHVQIDMAAGLLADVKAMFATQKMEVPIDLW